MKRDNIMPTEMDIIDQILEKITVFMKNQVDINKKIIKRIEQLEKNNHYHAPMREKDKHEKG